MIDLNTSPDKLRKSILQEAMKGKLTEQLPEDGDAANLLQSIAEEKQQLIQAGRIKKTKQLATITDDEIPFKIPDNWKWVRLANITNIIMGQSPKSKFVYDGNPDRNYFEFHQGKSFFGNKVIKKSNKVTKKSSRLVNNNYILMSVRAPVGNVNMTNRKIVLGRGLCGISPIVFSKSYLYYYLITQKAPLMRKATGSTFKAINKKIIFNELIPLPPLAEQMRIVNKLDILLPKVDSFKQSVDHIQTLRSELPPRLRRSFLQEAMQGKLTQQLLEDGDAADLLQSIAEEKQQLYKAGKIKKPKQLAAITDDEIPFKIPDNWKWVRLNDLSLIMSGRDIPKKYHSDKQSQNTIPYITGAGNFSNFHLKTNTYLNKEYANVISQKDDLLITVKGTIGKLAFLPYNTAHIARQIIAIRCFNGIKSSFIERLLELVKNDLSSKSKSIIPGIKQNDLKNLLVPLPPLNEQKRIIIKLNLLLSKIDRI